MELGVCYYPEHWPESNWKSDLLQMKGIGIEWIRIGEFAWSVIEPSPGNYSFGWLDRVLELMAEFEFKVVLGTPTATPPVWMLNKHPDLLSSDREGRPRKFGSRRHYCFSHLGYQEECRKICKELAKRYGDHPAVVVWQVDNEYGCHDTVRSYSVMALHSFRGWLKTKYGSIDQLNRQWGNVFWSMTYSDFDEIDLPNLTVTEPNPSQVLDFYRFSSDQVDKFNQNQVEAIREFSDRPILHNYMGRFTDFDHFKVGSSLEMAAWDSYPLGFLSQSTLTMMNREERQSHREYFMETGDPDFQAFNHELYYRVGQGRFWVMEQQPGPVNWAPYNPIPRPGMVRLWTWEAFFHGAEVVSYFRWRQAPWGQEQMHSGLLDSSGKSNPVMEEIRQTREEIMHLKKNLKEESFTGHPKNHQIKNSCLKAAIIFDYESEWAWNIQPMTRDFSYYDYLITIFTALRKKGFIVEIITPKSDWDSYTIIFIPLFFSWDSKFLERLKSFPSNNNDQVIVLGPRTGSKTENFNNDYELSSSQDLIPISVQAVSTYPDYYSLKAFSRNGQSLPGQIKFYWEKLYLNDKIDVCWKNRDGNPILVKKNQIYYLSGCADELLISQLIKEVCKKKPSFPDRLGLRMVPFKQNSQCQLLINYGKETIDISSYLKTFSSSITYIVGSGKLKPNDLTIIKWS